jgi:hypothetical protein
VQAFNVVDHIREDNVAVDLMYVCSDEMILYRFLMSLVQYASSMPGAARVSSSSR